MKSIKKYKFLAIAAFVISAAQVAFVSCDDDPGAEHYFTTTKEYASDFLLNREKFSEFSQIVQRSNMMTLLGTWGSFTVFAPTNEAVEAYLHSIGKTSIDELSKEDCDTITFNHIIEQAFYTTDFNDGTYPVMNMLDHPLTITCDSDTVSVPGQVTLAVYINKSSRMIQMDDSVENGVVHTMNRVIGTENGMLPDIIERDSAATLFSEALQMTHMSDSLLKYIDESYSVGIDSIDWTNDRLCIHTAVEYDNVAYMQHRYFKYTAFVPRNSVFERYGVKNLEDMKRLAKTIYDPVYPEDADVEDVTDRRNSLNRFISYHLLPFEGKYYSLTCVDKPGSTGLINMFNRRKKDIEDWYETMMPYSTMKFSFPSGTEAGLYINRRGIQSRRDYYGVKIRGARVIPASEAGITQTAVNGVYHYVDDILFYGVNTTVPDPNVSNWISQTINTQTDVFSERMRLDASTLSPDFMTSGARGHFTRSSIDGGRYGVGGQGAVAANNVNTCLGFKAGTAANFSFTDATHVHVRNRVLTFWSFEGDEVTVKGHFDLKVKLPPVPAGDWEIRFFTCVDFQSRGIVQFYIDDIPQGIPFDMRPAGTSPKIGWQSDASLGDEEQIAAFDKQFHYRGWMKGQTSSGTCPNGEGSAAADQFRDHPSNLRRVIGVFHSDGKTDHYLRFQQKLDSDDNEMNFDYIELCPFNVYANPDLPEDRL